LLDGAPRRRAGVDDAAWRLMTISGVGPITAAITIFAPPVETFRERRDFAAWVGLTLRPHPSGSSEPRRWFRRTSGDF
jgi:transposase